MASGVIPTAHPPSEIRPKSESHPRWLTRAALNFVKLSFLSNRQSTSLPQHKDLEPDPVPKPKAPQKTVVDSNLSEKFAILDQLISNGFPQAQAAAKAVKDVYLTGGKPSDDQLKVLRNMMYRSKMKAEADQFRVATGSHTQPDSAMVRGVVASFLAKAHAAKLAS